MKVHVHLHDVRKMKDVSLTFKGFSGSEEAWRLEVGKIFPGAYFRPRPSNLVVAKLSANSEIVGEYNQTTNKGKVKE